jgi:hypothetical protein
MKHSVDLKPFSDFWINCNVNISLSILAFTEPSYRILGAINAYNYDFTGEYCWWRHINLFYDGYFYKNIDFLNYNKVILNESDFDKQIKEFINNNKYIKMPLDLYYWMPNSFGWQRMHASHYQLITGYDDEKRVFYSYTDDFYGFGEKEIPYERFNKALLIDELAETTEITVDHNIKKFDYNSDLIINYAEIIMGNINYLSYTNYWCSYNEEHTFLRAIETYKIFERQKANIALLNDMKRRGYINENKYKILIEKVNNLKYKWGIIKSVFLKCFLGKKVPNYVKMNNLIWEAFEYEYEFWDMFIKKF